MKPLQDGEEEAYVLFWPPTDDLEEYKAAVVSVVMKRSAGFLAAIPLDFLSQEDLDGAGVVDGEEIVGPSTQLTVPSVSLTPSGPVPTGGDVSVWLVDLSQAAFRGLYRLSEAGLTEDQLAYFAEDTSVAPDSDTLLKYAREWVGVQGSQRITYYSAEEEVELVPDQPSAAPKKGATKVKAPKPKRQTQASIVAEQIGNLSTLLPSISQQLVDLKEEQMRLAEEMRTKVSQPAPRASQLPVTMEASNFAKLMGSPPRVKPMGLMGPPPKRTPSLPNFDSKLTLQEQAEEEEKEGLEGSDPLALAMLEQSRALTTLVAHLQSGDPLLENSLATGSTSSRGSQGREKLQRDLSNRSGDFFLSVMQNMFKRMKPAVQVPQSLEGLASTDLSMVSYLERFGGYGNSKDMGVVQYALAFITDLALRGDLQGVQEHLALLLVGIEQYVQDGNTWELGFQLMLLEDPPVQMWSYRNPIGVQTGRTRAFSGLCPQKWATVALAYSKEMDYIQNKRQEAVKRVPNNPPPVGAVPKPKGKNAKKGGGSPQNEEVGG